MPKDNVAIQNFNRGRISPLALARTDLARTALSAYTQKNWMPRVLGSMMLRPGTGYLSSTYNDSQAVGIPFVFSSSDSADLEFTTGILRVLVNDTPITRVSVSTTITNGTFGSNITSWTDNDESGAASVWVTGGYAGFTGTGTNAAILDQTITVAGGDQNIEHALRIVVQRGPVTLRVGSTSGGDEYISETALGTGTHSLALTPTGNFYIRFLNRGTQQVLLDSVAIESSGVMTLPTPYTTDYLSLIRYDQSGDVVYLACEGLQQRKIERRSTRSWSIVLYQPINGPFRIENLSTNTLTPSALSGNITLTSSRSLFKSTHVGALFSISSIGQNVSSTLSGEDQWSGYIKVTGLSRQFSITITGTWVGTVRIQRSVSEPGTWADVSGQTWTSNASTTYSDGLDNQIIYYRIGIKTGEYTSGSAVVALSFASGSITGYVRVTAYSSQTSVSAEVVKDLGGTSASTTWAEGAWSDYRGWPTATALYEGRCWWAGKANIWGSESDGYESFDSTVDGDSGPISKVIGIGPIDVINWLVPTQRLLLGTLGAEISARSNAFDEPLTPTNFNLKSPSTQGSAKVAAIKVDNTALFVQRSGNTLHELAYDGSQSDYASSELTVLVPEIGDPSIIKLAVQRQPDTRIHCVKSDGTVAILVYDKAENVRGWIDYETDGIVEDVVVRPGTDEDIVKYIVKRTINGSTKRYWEKWALESECQGGTVNKQADSFVVFTQSSSATITGLSHLEGEAVVVWANGVNYSPLVNGVQTTYTVASGSITIGTAVTNGIVGLPYTADYESVKLAYAAGKSTALTQKKKINYLGLIMHNTHYQGLRYGSSFDNLNNLPLVEDGKVTATNKIWEHYDKDMVEFDGDWDTDSRLYLRANAPAPCTLLAAVVGITTNDKDRSGETT